MKSSHQSSSDRGKGDSATPFINPDRTKFVTNIGRAAVWSAGLVVFGYTVATAIGDFKKSQADSFMKVDAKFFELQGKIDRFHDELQMVSANSWTTGDMERYMNKHRWENRNLNLIVSEPREIHAK